MAKHTHVRRVIDPLLFTLFFGLLHFFLPFHYFACFIPIIALICIDNLYLHSRLKHVSAIFPYYSDIL